MSLRAWCRDVADAFYRGEAAGSKYRTELIGALKLALAKQFLLFGIRCVLRLEGIVTIGDDALILQVPFSSDALDQIDDWCVEADLPIIDAPEDDACPVN